MLKKLRIFKIVRPVLSCKIQEIKEVGLRLKFVVKHFEKPIYDKIKNL